MRVSVDRDRCEGNAICVKYAPAVFELDDDECSAVRVDPVPEAEWENARKAVAECPRAALTLQE